MVTFMKSVWCVRLSGGLSCLFYIAAAVFFIKTASAHNVTVFAWVEGEMVHTQSKFSGGRKAKNATVEVYDTEGTKLLEGKTDENGEFAFKIPKKTELKVILLAGAGHRGEWTIPLDELQGETHHQTVPSTSQPVEEKKTGRINQRPINVGLSEEDIEKIVEKVLDKKLKPLLKMLVESKTKGPSASDILGGIGYILGLMGLGAYIHYRQKKKE